MYQKKLVPSNKFNIDLFIQTFIKYQVPGYKVGGKRTQRWKISCPRDFYNITVEINNCIVITCLRM
jgi:hypothetical protein